MSFTQQILQIKRFKRVQVAGDALVPFALLVCAVAAQGLNSYALFLGSTISAFAMTAMGLNVVLGWTGQLAFIDVAFFGIGAYTGARIGSLLELPLELALVIGIASGIVIGVALGALVSHLRGYYLSIVTIAFMFVLVYVYENADTLTGGVAGFSVPQPRLLVLGNREVTSDMGHFYISLILLFIVYLFLSWLGRQAVARGWRTLRESENVASAVGINVYRSKFLSIVCASAVLSLAGAWLPFATGSVFPATFGFNQLLFDFLIVVVGGIGSMRGAVFAAVGLGIANEYLRGLVGLSELMFGVALLLAIMFMPTGIYGSLAARIPGLRERVI